MRVGSGRTLTVELRRGGLFFKFYTYWGVGGGEGPNFTQVVRSVFASRFDKNVLLLNYFRLIKIV